MKGGTLFSGIGVPELALPWVDWRWCAEIDPFPSAVHAARFPKVPNLGDVTKVDWNAVAPVDILVFGSPCQSFSVAGKRLGLDDPRGNLALVALGIARRLRPSWLVFENVPGLLSSDDGRDFGAFLGLLGECGYGYFARVLDAQYFGVPQRRRRVFVVGYLGDWRPPVGVLLEPESLRGDSPPRREAGQRVAGAISVRPTGGGGLGTDFDCDGGLIHAPELSPALKARDFKGPSSDGDGDGAPLVAHSLRADGFDASEDGTGRGTPLVPMSAPTLQAGGNRTGGDRPPGTTVDTADSLIPFDTTQITHPENRSNPQPGDTAPTLRAMGHSGSHANAGGQVAVAFQERGRKDGRSLEIGGDVSFALLAPNGGGRAQERNVLANMAVRRLTPRECERLQGLPDDWTLVIYRGKPAADGPRYKAIGNAMAEPVLRWMGDRIRIVNGIVRSAA